MIRECPNRRKATLAAVAVEPQTRKEAAGLPSEAGMFPKIGKIERFGLGPSVVHCIAL